MTRPARRRRRLLWINVVAALLIIAMAQYDDHRRFLAAQITYEKAVTDLTLARFNYQREAAEYLYERKRNPAATKPAPFNPAAPPAPLVPEQRLVRRIRHALCLGAFAVAAVMPVVWFAGDAGFARRNRLIADSALALALFGTIGMMLGWGYWRNWNQFDPRKDAAGWGLFLIPLGATAVLIAMRRDRREITGGRCPVCDYDLAGNVSGVCPECGTAVTGAVVGAEAGGPKR